MEVLLNEQVPIPLWNEFLSANPFRTPFQSPEFYKIFNSVQSLSADVTAITDSGSIKALVVSTFQREQGIKKYFSTRSIIYGGPLIDETCPGALALLLAQVYKNTKGKVIYIETRNLSDYSKYMDVFLNNGYKYIPYLNFQVSTVKFDNILMSVSSSRMRQIKKAQRASVTWREAENIKEVEVFYNILSDLYKNKIGKPLFEFDFFKNFFEAGFGKYLLVVYGDKIIGGMFCPVIKGKAIYEFFICGLDDEYKEQYPSVMATWAAMEYAGKNGIPMFDFMGAGKPGENYGVRDFKARFGGELVEHGRYLMILNPFLYLLGKNSLKFMKILKL